jgi:hypothetical protein
MNACDDGGTKRAEIEVLPMSDVNISEAKGVMFYVDFSNVQIAEGKKMCASVTINGNDNRSNGPANSTGSAVGYYFDGNSWVQTTNVTSCRLEIPNNFAGWIYVPSSSFYDKVGGSALGDTFGDIFLMSMRCYTDGYVYSAENYIIFDEIVFVK